MDNLANTEGFDAGGMIAPLTLKGQPRHPEPCLILLEVKGGTFHRTHPGFKCGPITNFSGS